MQLKQIPEEWHDRDQLTFEPILPAHTAPRTVRDWRRCGLGPHWSRFEGCGRFYITVAEVRRFASSATTGERPAERTNLQGASA